MRGRHLFPALCHPLRLDFNRTFYSRRVMPEAAPVPDMGRLCWTVEMACVMGGTSRSCDPLSPALAKLGRGTPVSGGSTELLHIVQFRYPLFPALAKLGRGTPVSGGSTELLHIDQFNYLAVDI